MPERIWNLLDELFQSDKIISHDFVFKEISPDTKKPDYLATWIKDKKKYFFGITERQTILVTSILEKFPGIIDPDKESDEADPWLIALALEKRESEALSHGYLDYCIVSNESEKSSKKIPAVCKEYGVPHLNIKDFFAANGWVITIAT